MADEYVDFVEVFRREDGDYGYRAKSNNGQVLVWSEGYEDHSDAFAYAQQAFPNKEVRDLTKEEKDGSQA